MPTPPSNPSPTLSYSTPSPATRYRHQSLLLLLWLILNILAIPVGLCLASVAATHSLSSSLLANTSSPENWIAFLLWCPSSLGFLILPTIYSIECAHCRRLLHGADPAGLARAALLCRRAHLYMTLLALSFFFSLTKSFIHSRPQEFPTWITLLLLLALLTAAIELTRRYLLPPSLRV